VPLPLVAPERHTDLLLLLGDPGAGMGCLLRVGRVQQQRLPGALGGLKDQRTLPWVGLRRDWRLPVLLAASRQGPW